MFELLADNGMSAPHQQEPTYYGDNGSQNIIDHICISNARAGAIQ